MNTGSPGAPEGLFHVTFPESLLDLDSEWIKGHQDRPEPRHDSILDLLDMINYLATVNYYVEAISGSVNTAAGATTAGNVAGTIAALFVANEVRAAIGDNASLTLGQNGGDSLVMSAESGANTRVIAGSASIGAARRAWAPSCRSRPWRIKLQLPSATLPKLPPLGDIAVSAAAEGEVWDVSVADATALDASNFVSVGGGVNVVLSEWRRLPPWATARMSRPMAPLPSTATTTCRRSSSPQMSAWLRGTPPRLPAARFLCQLCQPHRRPAGRPGDGPRRFHCARGRQQRESHHRVGFRLRRAAVQRQHRCDGEHVPQRV